MLGTDGRKSKKRYCDENEGPPNERRNTAAADTGLGLGCNKAFYEVDRRDRTQNETARSTKMKQLHAEKKDITATLTLVDSRKKSYETALKAWQRNRESPTGSLIGCLRVLPF